MRLKFFYQSDIYVNLKLFAYNISIIFFSSIFRNMVRNVKLGHGLFDLIKTEQAAKVRILKGFYQSLLQLFTYFEPFHNHKYTSWCYINVISVATIREWCYINAISIATIREWCYINVISIATIRE